MERRIVWPLFAAVGLAALSGFPVGLAAEETPAPAPRTISTVAGNGTQRYLGDGALATATRLGSPIGVAVDVAGNLLITNSPSDRVFKVFGAAAPGLIAGRLFPSP